MGMKNPCTRGCKDRKSDCHATCIRYAQFAAAKRAEYEHRAMINQSTPIPRTFSKVRKGRHKV